MLWVQRKKYEQLANDRNLASVRVLTPERLTGGGVATTVDHQTP